MDGGHASCFRPTLYFKCASPYFRTPYSVKTFLFTCHLWPNMRRQLLSASAAAFAPRASSIIIVFENNRELSVPQPLRSYLKSMSWIKQPHFRLVKVLCQLASRLILPTFLCIYFTRIHFWQLVLQLQLAQSLPQMAVRIFALSR